MTVFPFSHQYLSAKSPIVGKIRSQKTHLHLELLEDRLAPAADVAGLLDFSSLQIDPNTYNPDNIIVRFHDDIAVHNDAISQVNQSIVAGATGIALLSWMPGLQRIALPDNVDVASALAAYETSPFVLYAEPDYQLYVDATTPNDFRFGEMWGLENTGQTGGTVDDDIDATLAWDINTGSGSTIVAVIDTGVDYTHPDLAANMWINAGEIAGNGIDDDGNGYVDDIHGYDFANNDGDPMDDNGHGTHVAGTVGAVGNNGIGVTGVIWDVQIMALKFLGADGSGSSSDAIAALDYAVSNGATISNNSWGGDPFQQSLFDAISSARDADHIFVTAAGNGDAFGRSINNDVFPFYPGNYELDNIITVAAIDDNGNLATFSNYGETTVDLAAPGVNILSTTVGGGYGLASGTSMATPHVAGVVALLRDLHPTWTYDQILNQILNTVEQTPELTGVTITGGRLNAAAALGNPEPPPPPPPAFNLPILDDFSDNVAQSLVAQIGSWDVGGQRLNVQPVADDDNLEGIATFNLASALPEDFEIQTTIHAEEGHIEVIGIVVRDNLTNGFVIFDYHNRFDYKFAGADMDQDRWIIGHRNAQGWFSDAFLTQTINAGTDYDVRVQIDANQTVTLLADGVSVVSHTYGDTLNDGQIGLGVRNAFAYFDDVLVHDTTPPQLGSLPIFEDFADGVADHFQSQSGIANVNFGRLETTPFTGQDAIQTILLDGPLPSNVELQTIINANAANGGLLSNGFLIFDYQGPTDFKYAGAWVGVDEWVIGHRDVTGWVDDVVLNVPIAALTDYSLRAEIENGTQVILFADGVPVLAYQFADSVTDGQVGIGTLSAVSRFDNVVVQQFDPPPPTGLPLTEDFQDGLADFFDPRSGAWTVTAGRYESSPFAGQDTVSTLRLTQPLPTNLSVDVTLNADAGSAGLLSNGLIIFDYQSATDFKFAGAFVGVDQWVIGHRDAGGWVTDVFVNAPINALTDYDLHLEIELDTTATLYVNGLPQVSHNFGGSLTDGQLALGTQSAVSRFDDVHVQQIQPPDPPTPGTLPVVENFDDGKADHFQTQLGTWAVTNGEYAVTPFVGQDGVSTLLISQALPTDLEIMTTVNANAAGQGYLSNAFVIFDYQSPTDFKFAGAYVGTDRWLIGRRTASGWLEDATLDTPINALADYDLRVVIEGDSQVTLYVGNVPYLSHTYGESLTDGVVGLGTREAISRFDDVVVQQFTPPQAGSLPLTEDFQDGVADFFDPRSGDWNVNSGRYTSTPVGGQDAISALRLAQPLPQNLFMDVTVNVNPGSATLLSNAFIIFDYHGPTDFKFAGGFAGNDEWVIGQRNANGWFSDVIQSSIIDPSTDYDLRLIIEADATATLNVNGVPQVSFSYGDSLTDGLIGLGTQNAVSHFDNLHLETLDPPTPPSPGNLPINEDFNDGEADHFQGQLGIWAVNDGRYEVAPVLGQDGVSTLLLSQSLPANLEVEVTFNANAGAPGYLSNGFIIFDYQSATDFKFAGAYVGTDSWLIGHRDAGGWMIDASLAAPINALTDYDLRLTIENATEVSLYAGGVFVAGHIFSDSVMDGQVGLGTREAVSRFDDLQVREYQPPASATLPVVEDFNDGVADYFEVRTGAWDVTGGRYEVTPTVGADGVSTLRIGQALPDHVEFVAQINAVPATMNFLSNAFLIFDYQGPNDFKFAGAWAGIGQWAIGQRNANDWITDAFINAPINANSDYDLRLVITDHTDVTLYINGIPLVRNQYVQAVTDGNLGLGSKNAVSRFDDLQVQQYTQPAAAVLPHTENFDDGVADYFQIHAGNWSLNNNRLAVTPVIGGNGISTVQFQDALPLNLDVRALVNADPGSSNYLSNGLIIFDYQSPTNFKFAGAYVGADQWVIGTRNVSGWQTDAWFDAPINPLTDYNLRLVIQNGTDVILYANGLPMVSQNYGQSVVDGEVGLGTRNAIARFDNLEVKPYVSGGMQVQLLDFRLVEDASWMQMPVIQIGLDAATLNLNLSVDSAESGPYQFNSRQVEVLESIASSLTEIADDDTEVSIDSEWFHDGSAAAKARLAMLLDALFSHWEYQAANAEKN